VSDPTVVPGRQAFELGDGPVGIVMVHGFSGSPASMRPMGEWFAEQGLAVEAIRLPGHGTDLEDLRGRVYTEWIEEAATALSRMRERRRTVIVVGQSMGGALAVHLAATRPGELDGLVLCSPYVFDVRLMALPIGRLFMKQVKGIGNDIAKPGQDEGAYDVLPVEGISTMVRLLQLARAELPKVRAPALVFEPGNDHAIPRSNPRKVFEALGSERKELIHCPRSYHVITLDHDAPMVRERVLAFARELDGVREPG
jgi:carboxylesterase